MSADGSAPPEQVLRALGLEERDARPGSRLLSRAIEPLGPASASVWLLRGRRQPLVLKCYRPERDPADVAWEHCFLHRLAATGFPAPRPVDALAGRSWMQVERRVWGTFTYLPGRPLLWEERPGLKVAGAFLASYHAASRLASPNGQRPTALPLAQLAESVPWQLLPASLAGDAGVERLRWLFEEFLAAWRILERRRPERIVIHGDCTTDNILVDGVPPRVAGLIDFESAYSEVWLADLAFGLWRSGRPSPDAIALDLYRVVQFVAGYHSQQPLTPEDLSLLPALIMARGLQLIVRWIVRFARYPEAGAPSSFVPTLARAEWARDHREELRNALLTAVQP